MPPPDDNATVVPLAQRPKPAEIPPGVAMVARIHIKRGIGSGAMWAELPGDFKQPIRANDTMAIFKANHPNCEYAIALHAVDIGR